MTTPALHIDAVDKTYGAGGPDPVHAVRAFSLEVRAGEIVALLGSSGCGKTSTLRMIAGFEEVTKGRILLAGREIQRLAPAKRNVAMAFEGYSLYPPLTIRENIAFALKSRRLAAAEIDRRVAEIAQLLEIEDILDRAPASVSGGQQQRVSLGRALIREADLHLLDEPMGQLEPQLRATLRGRIKHFLKERGLTTILVTHDQTEANALADRIAVMEGGVLQQFDAPGAIKARPANLFTGAFIGEPPMNLFAARAAAGENRVEFTLPGDVSLTYPADAFAPALRSTLAARPDVTLGVRPYAVRLTEDGERAEVFANQWLGDQSHIAAHFAGGAIVSVTHDRAAARKGQRMGVAIAAEDLHLFDTATGVAISHGGAPA